MADVKKKTPGWDVGVRQTVASDRATVWAFLVGEGLPLWLGETSEITLEKGARFQTDDDISGSVFSVQPGIALRVVWQPGEWEHETLLQLRLKDVEDGTMIDVHHEKLSGRDERKTMLGHWKGVLQKIASELQHRAP